MVTDLTAGGPAKPILTTPTSEYSPRLSPRGDLAAYLIGDIEADAPGLRAQLAVIGFPGGGDHPQVTTTGLLGRRTWGWIGDRDLYWQDAAGKVWSVTITQQAGQIAVSTPAPLLGGRVYDAGARLMAYSIGRERFLMSRPAGTRAPPQLVIMSDWRAALAAAAK